MRQSISIRTLRAYEESKGIYTSAAPYADIDYQIMHRLEVEGEGRPEYYDRILAMIDGELRNNIE